MRILGVSGSPVPNSNTDRAVQIVLAATGVKKTEFVKLSECKIAPCDACMGCIETNSCVKKDDGLKLADKAYKADALVVGGFTPYSSLDSRTKIFLERLYPLRHKHGLMAGKPGAAIVTCAFPDEVEGMTAACENGLSAIKNYMLAESMRYVGGIAITGNVPCIRCGTAQCGQSVLKKLYGPEAGLETLPVNRLEDCPETMIGLQKLGEKLVAACYGG